MKPRRLIILLAAIVLLAAPAAAAAQTYGDTISGYEYAFTSTDGKFAGTSSGAVPGTWKIDVQHTALCLSCTPTARITGGSFSLVTRHNGLPALASGAFVGGTVQVTNAGARCTNQTFAVNGILGRVGWWSSGSGSGAFRATLTHYRHSILGRCVTYGASVKGTLSLGLT
ncbi:MAG TPA: hypothetical protein VFK62_11785 [Gaiellaceae bacterium]|nr:hypothetical protein [Gaiellaceae bacterium]